jgi:radical SAM protein with 4Fe4S-binding SPASM domain
VVCICVVTFDWEDVDAREKVRHFEEKKSVSWAVVELTESCNFKCIWCYASSGLSNKHMSWENYQKLIKILSDAGVKQITLSGGEPTLYPHIREAVKLAKDSGFVVHMNTNGYLFTKELANELKGLGLSQIQTNIDSLDPKKHDYVRGKEGSFHRVVEVLKNAKAAGITCVSQTVLTKLNENEIFDIFIFARSLGIQRCRVWDITPSGEASGKMDIRPTNYVETLQKLDELAYNLGAKHIESGDPLFPNGYKTKLDVSLGYCIAVAGMLINIGYNGDAYFCVTQRGIMFNVFRDLNGRNMKDVYNAKLEEFMKAAKINSECSSCVSSSCKGGCYTRRSLENKDYFCQRLNGVSL